MPEKSGNAQLTIHDLTSAPEASRPTLEGIEKSYGFIPSLYRIFAGSPAVLQAYLKLAENFGETSLSKKEQNAVLLAAAVENKCHFCVAAHTWTSQGAGVSEADIKAIREGNAPEDARLAAVARLTRHLVAERGFGSPEEISTFVESGFQAHQVMEVVLGITLKTLSNYTNHLADTPIDEPLKQFA